MSKRRRSLPQPLRTCVWCHVAIAEKRSPVLLTTDTNQIVGPFHAGCAERIRLQAKRNPDTNWLIGAAHYGKLLEKREETLPW